ncbi:MAG TPA: phosphoadenosine phosphosulfate reductase family protein [Micromonosporaceae bacterium]|nr:phosphoadenosine phosphosulfate reductase family protein [Micromonosporaceae bacterium]
MSATADRHGATSAVTRARLQPPEPLTRADLRRFDAIIVNSSAGKDSQVALDVVAGAARAAGMLDRVTVLHCDLDDVEWPGVIDLAARQAAHYGVRFAMVRREADGLLDLVRARGRWPSHHARFCTSATKRQPSRRFMTQLVAGMGLDRPAWILNCLGLRAEESRARASRPVLAFDPAASNLTQRKVWTWLPVHDWTLAQVWSRTRDTGVPYHPIYDQSMRRLSCSLCPLAARADIVRACQLRPDLARRYIAVEDAIGHDFRPGLSLRAAYAQAEATASPTDPITTGATMRVGRWSR